LFNQAPLLDMKDYGVLGEFLQDWRIPSMWYYLVLNVLTQ
jgi:hypothetical protein